MDSLSGHVPFYLGMPGADDVWPHARAAKPEATPKRAAPGRPEGEGPKLSS